MNERKTAIDKKLAVSLGALTSILFLLAIYLDDAGRIDLTSDDPMSAFLKGLILLLPLVYLGGNGLKEFVVAISSPENRDKMMRNTLVRFWCFAGGVFGVFLPGAILLTAAIS